MENYNRYERSRFQRRNNYHKKNQINKARTSVTMTMFDYEFLSERERMANFYENELLAGYDSEKGIIEVSEELKKILEDKLREAVEPDFRSFHRTQYHGRRQPYRARYHTRANTDEFERISAFYEDDLKKEPEKNTENTEEEKQPSRGFFQHNRRFLQK